MLGFGNFSQKGSSRESIPADIDESANQEPPTSNCRSWVDTNGLLVRECSNSNSSGYYSSSTTQSAPPTCDQQRFSITHSLSTCSQLVATKDEAVSSPPLSDVKLRRSKSCVNRSWLAKNQRKGNFWPKISGISTSGSKDNSFTAMIDTNSCPAAIYGGADYCDNHKLKFALPPLGEVRSSSPSSEDSPIAPKIMNFSSSSDSPSPKRRVSDITFDTSFYPANKKQRLASSFMVASPKWGSSSNPEMDSTLPSDDVSSEANDALPEPRFFAPKPSFELLRHHSTPMPPCNNPAKEIDPYPESPINHLYMSSLGRCSSDPVADKAGRFDHSHNLDGQRTRALPVIDRTASGLNCVTVDTVSDLVSTSKHKVNHVIIDCRFPYEYEGGHIKGAINIFTHSDLVQEIFDRVPAQRPPGSTGPPRLLGQWLAKRLATSTAESALPPCELISDSDETTEEYIDGMMSDASELELAANEMASTTHMSSDMAVAELEANTFHADQVQIDSQELPFVVIFHCEFSSQRAPALATFLRSVDRVSNYHRYPFLYFPEIYVMKGGYSAFYQKFPRLCCPQTYVKMFHRDYRSHLRLYKRLTHRVSSACLACIRPHQKELACINPAMDSFCQVPKPAVCAALNFDSPLLDSCLSGRPKMGTSLSVRRPTQGCDLTADKENQRPESSFDLSDSTSSGSSANSSGDSSLNLAEVVVRVGRRVIAATLCNSDPATSELARSLDQFKKRSLNTNQLTDGTTATATDQEVYNVRTRPLLKRSKTTSVLDAPRNRLSFGGGCGILNELGSFEAGGTPAFRRNQTVRTPKLMTLRPKSGLIGDLMLAETPISVAFEAKRKLTTSRPLSSFRMDNGAQSFDCSLSTSSD